MHLSGSCSVDTRGRDSLRSPRLPGSPALHGQTSLRSAGSGPASRPHIRSTDTDHHRAPGRGAGPRCSGRRGADRPTGARSWVPVVGARRTQPARSRTLGVSSRTRWGGGPDVHRRAVMRDRAPQQTGEEVGDRHPRCSQNLEPCPAFSSLTTASPCGDLNDAGTYQTATVLTTRKTCGSYFRC